MITKDNVLEWKDHPVTKAYFAGIRQKVLDIKEFLGEGGTLSGKFTAENTHRAVGRIEGLTDAITIDLDEVVEQGE